MFASLILSVILIYFVYHYIAALNYWKKRGVSFTTPWPIVGNMGANFLGRRALAHIIQDLYSAFPKKRYVGIYDATSPELLLRDPELIKRISIKEFDSFADHKWLIPDDVHPVFNSNLFSMKGGEKWHNTRSALSPAFTTSKLKSMFVLMKECSENFSSHFSRKGETVELEIKEALGRYTNDVIASTLFGVSCDSINQPNNDFYTYGLSIGNVKFRLLTTFAYTIAPSLFKLLKITIIAPETEIFFSNVVRETIKLRKETSMVRPDLIQLFMKAGKSEDSENSNFTFSHDDLTAQALIFHFGGVDSSATMISHTIFELAINPDIQAKLREEVDETLKKYNGDVTYESFSEMNYLDMVVSESLRKWPPFAITDRIVTKPIEIEPEHPDEKPLYIEPRLACIIPIYAIHRDPKYFPNPDRFDPERFSEENKPNIKPFSYIPFGQGPRNCIGLRYALLLTKLMIVEILSKFEVEPLKKTKIPLELSKRHFTVVPDEGFWLALKPRQKNY